MDLLKSFAADEPYNDLPIYPRGMRLIDKMRLLREYHLEKRKPETQTTQAEMAKRTIQMTVETKGE